MSAEEKQATAEQAFVFPAPVTSKRSDEIGREARKRGLARLDDIISAEEKQATAEQAFVFPAPVTSKRSDEIGREARKRGLARLDTNGPDGRTGMIYG